jgi:hypothetical protein
MPATVDNEIYLPVGVPYDPILVMAVIAGINIFITSPTELGSNVVEENQIAANAITATKIMANSITADHLQADSVTSVAIKAGAVTTELLFAGAVTADKIDVTSLSAISAALGEVTSGIVTAATVRTSAQPTDSRVIMESAGLRGYDATLGLTFRIPTDGQAPLFASGVIQYATIEHTTIVNTDYQSSSELPWVELNDAGLSYREALAVGKYNTFEYGDGTLYGVGVTGYVGNSSRPFVSVEAERTLADIRCYNRSENPSGAAVVGDLCVVGGKLMICTVAGTGAGATWTVVGEQEA